jgi:hypothetical protein
LTAPAAGRVAEVPASTPPRRPAPSRSPSAIAIAPRKIGEGPDGIADMFAAGSADPLRDENQGLLSLETGFFMANACRLCVDSRLLVLEKALAPRCWTRTRRTVDDAGGFREPRILVVDPDGVRLVRRPAS